MREEKNLYVGNVFLEEREYWLEKLFGELVAGHFPSDHDVQDIDKRRTGTVTCSFNEKIVSRLMQLRNGADPRLHMIFVAVIDILIYRYTGADDIVVGTTIDRQEREAAFVNTILPLRNRIEDHMTFKQFLLQVRDTISTAVENQNYPLEELVDQLSGSVGESISSLFEVVVLLENIHDKKYLRHIQPAVLFSFNRTDESIHLEVEYRESLYKKETMERIVKHFERILEIVIFDVDIILSSIDMFTPEERQKLIVEFNNTAADYRDKKGVHELFEAQAAQNPGAVALISDDADEGDGKISYRDLNIRANQLANTLKAAGVKKGTIVELMVQPSLEAVVGILGTLKAGGVYLPVDPDYPLERIHYMQEDSKAAVRLTVKAFEGKIPSSRPLIVLDNEDIYRGESSGMENSCDPSEPAYVIYTSGTTGNPKGVLIEHGGLANYIRWAARMYVKDEKVNFPFYTTIGFDLTVTSIFTPLVTGNTIIIYRGEDKEFLLEKIFRENRVGVVKLTPVHLMVMGDILKEGNVPGIKRFIVGGDKLETQWAQKAHEHFKGNIEICNEYGPTEASVGCMIYKYNPAKDKGASVPIGVPAENVRIYLQDKNMNEVPVGGVGELYIAGNGLAAGYINNPGYTAEKFIPNPFEPGKKMFKTGDLARRLADGNLEFLGRADHQVKIRGYRIETGEIENYLLKHEHVGRVVVVAKDDDNGYKYLAAYIVPTGQGEGTGIDSGELRTHLSKFLPEFMIPSYFVQLEKIPVSANGKLDRKSLPDPMKDAAGTASQYQAPTTELEKISAEIWQDVMGVERVGINDGYFALGGDSIKSIQILARLHNAGWSLQVQDLFQYTTIKELVDYIKPLKRIPNQETVEGEVTLTPIQEWFFESNLTDEHHFNLPVMLHRLEGFDVDILKKIFDKLVEHHDALRLVFKREEGKIRQINKGFSLDMIDVDVFDMKSENDYKDRITAECSRIQGSINLSGGPLVRPALFKTKNGDYLLIAVHHLVIDGVSWRILLEDIETLYGQHIRGEEPGLPPKTDSFKLWSEKLFIYSNSPSFLKEKSYWAQLESNTVPGIKKDFEGEENEVKDTRSISFHLEEEETALLLTKVNEAFRTGINDILLTALGLAVKKTFGRNRVLIALEGHGREEIPGDVDVNRTVGWFTSLYPVLMDISYEENPGRQVKEIKETLRKIPNKGIGYGILKYLTSEENKKELGFKLNPQISFNYLGQFDADAKQISLFEIVRGLTGNTRGLKNKRGFELDIIGLTANNRLTMTISYNETQFKRGTTETLSSRFRSELQQIITFCCSKENIERTPSDFTYTGLSIDSIDRLMLLYPDFEDLYTLTPMQEGMTFHSWYDDFSNSYFEQISYRLQGELNIVLVEKSLNELFIRHDILRTAFVYKDIELPVQVVLKNRLIDFYYEDIGEIGEEEEKENFIRTFKEKDKKRGFDLSDGALMRVAILRVRPSEYEFTWSFHHILMDGWCIGILNSEFFEIYNSYLESRPYRLPGIKPYRNYIRWLQEQDKEESAEYWQNYLDSFEEQTGIPKTVVTNKGENGYQNETASFALGVEKTARLNAAAARYRVTMNTLTRSIWGILLGKYNGKDDVVFGAVVSGRPAGLVGVETMVGLFINTIPVRIRFEQKMKFFQLLQKVQEDAIAGEPYHYNPLAEIQARTPLKQQLIDHLFIFENYPVASQIEGYENEGNKNKPTKLNLLDVEVFEQTNYDFNVVLGGAKQFEITFQYNRNAYNADSVERIAHQFILAIDRLIENEDAEIGELASISDREKSRLLYDFNNTGVDYPKDKTINELFEEQVRQTPDNIAFLGDGGSHLTYDQLNRKSNKLAHLLLEKGILPDTIVGIMVGRSMEMIAGILGIVKTGASYLPLDPEYPEERIHFMLKDSGTGVLLAESGTRVKIKTGVKEQVIETIDMNSLLTSSVPVSASTSTGSNLTRSTHPRHPLYIIYTSGTTGRPKGVMIEHTNVVRLFFNDRCLFDFNEADVWTMFHSYCFDFSVWEMYGALLFGGKLVVIPKIVAQEPRFFLKVLKENNVTILNQTPSAFYNLINEELKHEIQPNNLRYVIFGGEALSPVKLKQWRQRYPGVKLINMFGITETTVHVTYKEVTDKEIDANVSCIGTPIPTLSAYLLDQRLDLSPIGIPGELCVGGSGVGRGYLNRPELTQEKFIRNPFKKDERMYKSGDLAVFSADGEMKYLGRIDRQVQVRGFRVEAGEIENRLLMHEDIKDVVVIAKEDKENNIFLAAYIVSNIEPSVSQLRAFLSDRLPDYMLPAYFIPIPRIPLTANGKIDKSRLPEPGIVYGEEYVPPADKVEEELIDTWKDVLELERMGVTDNFFNIGGDSIKAIRLISAINKRFHTDITLVDLFTNNSIKELAHIVKSGTTVSCYKELEEVEKEVGELKTTIMESGNAPEGVEDVFPMSDIEKGMIFHSYRNPDKAIYHDQFVYNRQYTMFDPGLFRRALELLVEKHPALRVSYNVEDFDEFVHFIHRSFPAVYKHFDIRGLNRPAQRQHVEKYMDEDKKDRWDITSPPLWRMATFDLGGDNICAVWTFHHAILDGWSNASLMTELNNTYLELKADKNYIPTGLKISYKDFIIQEMVEKRKVSNIDFWKKELLEYKRIPFSGVGKNDTDEVHHRTLLLKQNLIDSAKYYNTSLKDIAFAAYVYMLSMLTYENDVVVGLVSNNRPEKEDGDKLIGCFLNTVPFRIRIPAGITYKDYIHLVDRKLVQLKQYEKMTFYEIVKNIGERNRAGNPISDTIFYYTDFHIYKEAAQEEHQAASIGSKLVQGYERTNTLFDFLVSPYLNGIGVGIRHSTSIISVEMMTKLCGYFERFLELVVSQPDAVLEKENIIFDREKQKLLYEFNDSSAGYTEDKTIHGLFEDQVQTDPHRTAVIFEDKRLTYKELDEKAGRLARMLREKGVVPDAVVGIMVERSIEMITGIFGIVKSGGAYLPIDPGYPRERINYMLEDSRTKILLTTKNSAKAMTFDKEMIYLDFPFNSFNSSKNRIIHHSENPVYVIYTSGTTGKPKGVVIEHRSLVSRINWMQKKYPIDQDDTILQSTTYTFDVSAWEIFWWSVVGASLCILSPGGEKDPEIITQTVERNHVTIMHSVPSMLSVFLDYLKTGDNVKRLSVLKQVISSGEALSLSNAERFNDLLNKENGTLLANLYGPTEATIYASYFDCSEGEEKEIIPIGKPIGNVRLYILDKHLHLQPPGVPGELGIAGIGLGRGYLNQPELTAEKFSRGAAPSLITSYPLPLIPIYRTGDLARWLPDGNVEFLGRIDHQVKIRGFRIELGEIETQLVNRPEIKEAVVSAKTDEKGARYLHAYIVSENDILALELKEYLLTYLPDYMIPSYFSRIEKIPLTSNGKIDRDALNSVKADLKRNVEYTAPTNEMEEKIAEIWEKILRLDRIGIYDSFFELGGHSLDVVKAVFAINQEFNVELPVAQVLLNPTIRKLSIYIFRQQHREITETSIGGEFVLLNIPDKKNKNVFCFPPSGGLGISYMNLALYLNGYNLYSFNIIKENRLFQQYADTIMEIQEKGPYRLFGYSGGGNLAFDVARELEKRGELVSDIIMVDSFRREVKFEFGRENMEDVVGYVEGLGIDLEQIGMGNLSKKIEEKREHFEHYFANSLNRGKVNSRIHLITSANRQDMKDRLTVPELGDARKLLNLDWEGASESRTVYEGFGKHFHMFRPDFVGKNVAIIRKILENSK